MHPLAWSSNFVLRASPCTNAMASEPNASSPLLRYSTVLKYRMAGVDGGEDPCVTE